MGEDGNPTRKDNGVESIPVDMITITVIRRPWHVDAKIPSNEFDLWIGVLDQVKRTLEGELRKAQALQLQEQLRQQAENARIAADIRRRG